MSHYRVGCDAHRRYSKFAILDQDDQLRQTRPAPPSARGLRNPKEVEYDEYDGDNDQNVDPTAGTGEAWTNVPAEKAKQPQDY